MSTQDAGERERIMRIAADPGMYAGPKGNRTMGQWITDALISTPSQPDYIVRHDRSKVGGETTTVVHVSPSQPVGEDVRQVWGAWRKSLGRFHTTDPSKDYVERVYGSDPDFEIIRLVPADTIARLTAELAEERQRADDALADAQARRAQSIENWKSFKAAEARADALARDLEEAREARRFVGQIAGYGAAAAVAPHQEVHHACTCGKHDAEMNDCEREGCPPTRPFHSGQGVLT